MTNEFRHTPLTTPGDRIRVIRLVPPREGIEDAIIRCNLYEIERTQEPYTCLSYCWGTDQSTRNITINGDNYPVRTNLYNFLRAAVDQRPHLTEALWIDAISIDMRNNHERNDTVKMTGHIYREATRTIVWLGTPLGTLDELYAMRSRAGTYLRDGDDLRYARPHPDDRAQREESDSNIWSDMILEMGGRLCEIVPSEYSAQHSINIPDTLNSIRWINLCASFTLDYHRTITLLRGLWQGLMQIVTAQYWSRAWIRQEVILSQSAQILTTSGTLNLGDILYVILFITQLISFESETRAVRERDELRFLCHNPPWQFDRETFRHVDLLTSQWNEQWAFDEPSALPIDEALSLTHRTGCFDLRDRVFSIYSFIEPDLAAIMPVDYDKTPMQIYAAAMAACVYHHGDDMTTDEDGVQVREHGSTIHFAASELAGNLMLCPSPASNLVRMDLLLNAFSRMPRTRASNRAYWAIPSNSVNDSPTEIQERRDHNLIGLYASVWVDSLNAFLVLEFLDDQGFSLDHLAIKQHPRTWLLQGNTQNCFKGRAESYFWPEPPDVQNAAGPSHPPDDGGDDDDQGGGDDDQGGDDDAQARRERAQRIHMEVAERGRSRALGYSRQGGSGGNQAEFSDYPEEQDGFQEGNFSYPEEYNTYQGGNDVHPGRPNDYKEQQYGPQLVDPEYQEGHYGHPEEYYGHQGGYYGHQEATYNNQDVGPYNNYYED